MNKKVIKLGKQGKSRVQICAALGICYETFQNYQRNHKSFSEAVKKAMLHCQAWWEDQGQDGITRGHGFDGVSFIFQMKNRFRDRDNGYHDNHTIEHKGNAFQAFMNAASAGAAPVSPDKHKESEDDES